MDLRNMKNVTILPQPSKKSKVPTNSTSDGFVAPPMCGDEWCLNGTPAKNANTYWLCETCSAMAPDAVRMGLTRVPKGTPQHKIKTANANYLSTKLRCSKG